MLKYLLLVLCYVIVNDASSFTDKQEERNFTISSVKKGPTVNWVKIDEAQHECADDWDCKTYGWLCSKYTVIRENCKNTCGGCKRLAAPPNCKVTRFGCCWDNVTIATSANKENCPRCQDKYDECKDLKRDCYRADIKVMCPTSCGIPCKQCLDNQYQAPICPMYKRYGFCQVSPKLMSTVCQHTCNLCDYVSGA